MDPFTVAQEGDVASSPFPLVKSKRSANRYLFAVVKLLLFASPPHLFSWNGGFQRRAGSINGPLYSCTRFPVRLVFPLVKSKRSANRYLFAVVKLLLFASPRICSVGMDASSDELEASIDSMDPFTVAQASSDELEDQ